jgi:hypothetical protein
VYLKTIRVVYDIYGVFNPHQSALHNFPTGQIMLFPEAGYWVDKVSWALYAAVILEVYALL